MIKHNELKKRSLIARKSPVSASYSSLCWLYRFELCGQFATCRSVLPPKNRL